ncbi:MAG: hypothetical protein ACI4XR_02180 [Bacilli bacterium]
MKLYNIVYIFENKVIEYSNGLFYEQKFSKNTLNNGIIYNKNEFEIKYNNFLKKNKLKRLFKKNSKIIIHNGNISINDLNKLEEIFSDLSISVIKYLKDYSLLNVTKNDSYLLGNEYLTFLYITRNNTKKVLSLNTNELSSKELLYLINTKLHKNLIILSNNESIIKKFNNNNVFIISEYEKYMINIVKNYYTKLS